MRVILASQSPRRKQLLQKCGVRFRMVPSRVPEPPPGRISPVRYARELALTKAKAVAQRFPNEWVLGADTIVVRGRKILGKPEGVRGAIEMLRLLSGTRHRVITGVALIHRASRRKIVRHDVSWVTMRKLSHTEITRYAKRHLDKSGSYSVQDKNDPVVTKVIGSYSNVVGLPVELVRKILHALRQ